MSWDTLCHFVRRDLFCLIRERLSNSYRKPWMKTAHRRKGIITRAPANLLGGKKITKVSLCISPDLDLNEVQSLKKALRWLRLCSIRMMLKFWPDAWNLRFSFIVQSKTKFTVKTIGVWDISTQMFKREIECLHIQWWLSCPVTPTSWWGLCPSNSVTCYSHKNYL